MVSTKLGCQSNCWRLHRSDGRYVGSIGRAGEGPGEFRYPSALGVDDSGRVYVASRSVVTVFDRDGEHVTRFGDPSVDGYTRGVVVGPRGAIYISCTDVLTHKIIRRYSSDFVFLSSFCDTYVVGGTEVDRMEESFIAGGYIDVAPDGSIYFTQMAPYEIRRFSPGGTLELRIFRKADFMVPEPNVERHDNGTMEFHAFAGSSGIFVLGDGRFINRVGIPDGKGGAETVLDLFDADGRLLCSKRYGRGLFLQCDDDRGYLYASDVSEYPKAVRYELVISD